MTQFILMAKSSGELFVGTRFMNREAEKYFQCLGEL